MAACRPHASIIPQEEQHVCVCALFLRLPHRAESIADCCCRFGKWRERRNRVEKDVRRTDRAQAYYRKKSNVRALQNVLLSYGMYNFDLGYVQAGLPSTQRVRQESTDDAIPTP